METYQVKVGANVVIPANCVAPPASCNSFSGATYGICTTATDGSCHCSTTSQSSQTSPVTYLASGSQIELVTTRSTGSMTNQTAYYCVQGSQMLMRGRAGTGAYIYSFTRQ